MQVDICEEITHNYGVMYCHLIEIEPLPLSELAPRFGLFFTPNTYEEINKAQAEAVVKHLLYPSLAYHTEDTIETGTQALSSRFINCFEKTMTETEAQALANHFFDCFDEENAQYYTNGNYYSYGSVHYTIPATNAISDTGILIIGTSRSACLWVEERD